MIIEIDYNLTTKQEIDNTVGKRLNIADEISSLLVEVEFSAYKGWAGSYWEPEELPSMEVENLDITKVYNEHGNAISITPAQSKLLEDLIDNSDLEDKVWDYLTASQEDVGDY